MCVSSPQTPAWNWGGAACGVVVAVLPSLLPLELDWPLALGSVFAPVVGSVDVESGGRSAWAAEPISAGSKIIWLSVTMNVCPRTSRETVTVTRYRLGGPAGTESTFQDHAESSPSKLP